MSRSPAFARACRRGAVGLWALVACGSVGAICGAAAAAEPPEVAVDPQARQVLTQVGTFYAAQGGLQATLAFQGAYSGGGLTSLPANLDKAVRQRRLNPAIIDMLPADVKAQLQSGAAAPGRTEGTYTLAFQRGSGRLALVAPHATLTELVWDGKAVLEHVPAAHEYLLRDATTPGDVWRAAAQARLPVLYALALVLDGDAPRRLAAPDHFRRVEYLDKTAPRAPGGYWHHLKYSVGTVAMHLYFEASGDPWLRRVELEGARQQKLGITVLALQPQGGAQKLFEDKEQAQLTIRLVYQFASWKTSPEERLFKLPKPRGAKRVENFTTPALFDIPAILQAGNQ